MAERTEVSVTTVLSRTEPLDKEALASVFSVVLQQENPKDFFDFLNRFIFDREQRIQDICAHQYSKLLGGLELVSSITSEYQTAQDRLQQAQTTLQSSSQMLQVASHCIEVPKERLSKLLAVQAVLQKHRRGLELLKKANEQVLNKRFLSALGSLKAAEQLDLFDKPGSAVKILTAFIPKLRETVDREAGDELSIWLVGAKSAAEAIGEQNFSLAEERLSLERARKNRQERLSVNTRNSLIMSISGSEIKRPFALPSRELCSFAVSRATLTQEKAERIPRPKDETTSALLDFGVLHTLDKIFDELGQSGPFKEKLKTSRRLQVLQNCTINSNVKVKLKHLLGHLVIERDMSEEADKFCSDDELQRLWLESVSQVERSANEYIRGLSSMDSVIVVKEAVLLFIKACEAAGFSHRLYELKDLLKSCHWHFVDLLIERFRGRCESLILNDSFTTVDKDSLDPRLIQLFELDISPQSSKVVVGICQLVMECCELDRAYIADLADSAVLVRTVDRMVMVLSEVLGEQVRALAVLQVAYMSLNVQVLFQAFEHFYRYLQPQARGYGDSAARATFIHLREMTEDAVISKVINRIQEALRSEADYMPKAPGIHFWVEQLMYYIESTADSLRNLCNEELSVTVAQASFKCLVNDLLDDLAQHAKNFNFHYIVSLSMDVNQMELFVANSAKLSRVPSLQFFLCKLKEFTCLFVTNDLETLLNKPLRQVKYANVSLPLLQLILPKYKEVKGKLPKRTMALNVAKRLGDFL
jgi:hypothetical protein